MKIDSSNKNNDLSAILQLRLERETSDGVGRYMKNISADVIFYVWGHYIFWRWMRTKFSCEVQHRL